jgi:hypothetical protein
MKKIIKKSADGSVFIFEFNSISNLWKVTRINGGVYWYQARPSLLQAKKYYNSL